MDQGPDIMKRSVAKAAGLTRYFSGKACPHGHICERYVSTGQCVSCLLGSASEWRQANRPYVRQYAKDRYWADPVKHNQAARLWRDKNPGKQKMLNAAWHARNPLGRHTHNSNRMAREKNAIGSHTMTDIMRLGERQKWKCVYCRKPIQNFYHADHITALSRGGSNNISNIQLLCPDCNQRKHTRDPIKFAQQIGLLL